MWLVSFSTVFFLSFYGSTCWEDDPVPHPECQLWSAVSQLDCRKANLTIPDNFNVSSMPSSFQILNINCPNSSASHQCIILRADCQPIPLITTVTRVVLRGFQATDPQQRPPIDKFLSNIKHEISGLTIEFSRLNHLDNEFFQGFRSLESLSMDSCGIHTLATDAFQSLTFLGPGVAAERNASIPKLMAVGLNRNAIERLDWSVFEPLAETLVALEIRSQKPGLISLSRSGAEFVFSRLEKLELSYNALTELPREIRVTITPRDDRYIEYHFEDNNLCNKSDCSCCELEEFVRWGKSIPQGLNRIGWACGNNAVTEDYSFPGVINLDVYANCSKPGSA